MKKSPLFSCFYAARLWKKTSVAIFCLGTTAFTASCSGSSSTTNTSDDGACSEEAKLTLGDPCFVRDTALNVDHKSELGLSKSHNTGQNCMNCHQAHGPGKGLYTVAGTLYKSDGKTPEANGKVVLYADGARASTIATIQADALGNFYTTDAMPMPDKAIFISIFSADGSIKTDMPFPTESGACNQCHAGEVGAGRAVLK